MMQEKLLFRLVRSYNSFQILQMGLSHDSPIFLTIRFLFRIYILFFYFFNIHIFRQNQAQDNRDHK